MPIFEPLPESVLEESTRFIEAADVLARLGYSPEFCAEVRKFTRLVSPIGDLTYTQGTTTEDLQKAEIEAHGRGVVHTIPFGDNWIDLYAKGTGDYKLLNKSSEPYAAYDAARAERRTVEDSIHGGMTWAESAMEFTYGILAFTIMNPPRPDLTLAEVVRQGCVLPLLVTDQSDLSIWLMDKFDLKTDPWASTILQITPASHRISKDIKITPDNKGSFDPDTYPEIMAKLGSNMRALLEYGMMWNPTALHPQNVYDSVDSATVMADLAEILHLLDLPEETEFTSARYHKLAVIEHLLAFVLQNNGFFPAAKAGLWDVKQRDTAIKSFLSGILASDDEIIIEEYALAMVKGRFGMGKILELSQVIIQSCYKPDIWLESQILRNQIIEVFDVQPKVIKPETIYIALASLYFDAFKVL